MDVSPVGPGAAGINLSSTSAPAMAAPAGGISQREASVASITASDALLINELSQADVARLVRLLEPPASPHGPQLEGLLRSAPDAVSPADITRVVSGLASLVVEDPRAATTVLSDQRVHPIRAEIETTANRMVSAARLDAEARVADAAELSEMMDAKKLADWDAPPATLVGLARHLLESGGFTNYLRAANVAQAVIDAAHWAPANANISAVPPARPAQAEAEADPIATWGTPSAWRGVWNDFRRSAPRRIRALWVRAPLLILLLAWLAVGVAFGLVALLIRKFAPQDFSPSFVNGGFELWATGFLVLVLFGFYMRVRNVRFW